MTAREKGGSPEKRPPPELDNTKPAAWYEDAAGRQPEETTKTP